VFTSREGAVAIHALACGYSGTADIHHGRLGAGLTLTLDMAVSRALGGAAGRGSSWKGQRNAKASSNDVAKYYAI
jgi:hypothetical protein